MIKVMNHFHNYNRTAKQVDVNRKNWFIAARENRDRKEKVADDAEQSLLDLVTTVALATAIEIKTFHAKLDVYDEATVIALMENQQLLDVINEQIADMLSRAHVLEDGRRVFKTEDGIQVFDEHGEQIDEAIIHPDAISDDKPTWEAYAKKRDIRDTLINERKELLEYQEKLDHAREHSNSDDFTVEELDGLDSELEADMPPAVAKHISGMKTSTAVELKTEFKTPADPAISATVVGINSIAVPSPQIPS